MDAAPAPDAAPGGESLATIGAHATQAGLELLVAGGVRDLDALRRVRDTGAAGIILGEALLSGAIDYPAAMEAVG
jgi:phosphoribosylformimino-5-aminoimidazole carboxamide ribonucleotide (ProFAR) isomerase